MLALSEVQVQAELEELLERLPDSIEGAYEITMNRIEHQAPNKKIRAMSTLGWVAYTQRLLSIQELQHALAIGESPDGAGEKYMRQAEDIIADCCGLLVSDLDDMVRYVHRSAREFFDKRIRDNAFLPNFDKRIAMVCAKHLYTLSHRPQIATAFRSRNKQANLKEHDFPFTRYAGQYLHTHHRRIRDLQKDEDLLETIYLFVSDEISRALYSRLLFKFDAYNRTRTLLEEDNQHIVPRQRLREPLKPLHVAVYLGHPGVVERLIKEEADVNALDPYGQSALIVAIKSGRDRVAGILLNNGAEIDLTTKRGHVILLYAMERDYETVRQIIGENTIHISDETFLEILGIFSMIMLALLQVLQAMVWRLLVGPRTTPLMLTTQDASSLVQKDASEVCFNGSLERYRKLLHAAYEGNADITLDLLEPSVLQPINLELVSQEAERTNEVVDSSDVDVSDMYRFYESDSDYDELDSCSESGCSDSSDHFNWGSGGDSDADDSDAGLASSLHSTEREGKGSDIENSTEDTEKTEDTEDTEEAVRKEEEANEEEEEAIGDTVGNEDAGEAIVGDEDADEPAVVDEDAPDLEAKFIPNSDFGAQGMSSEDQTSDEINEVISTDDFNDADEPSAGRSQGTAPIPVENNANKSVRDEDVANLEDSGPRSKLDAIRTAFLRSACFLAVERRKHKVVEIFLRRGISPSLTNFEGQSLLHRATARNDQKLVKLLLDNKAEVDQRDNNGRTPLMANANVEKAAGKKSPFKKFVSNNNDLMLE